MAANHKNFLVVSCRVFDFFQGGIEPQLNFHAQQQTQIFGSNQWLPRHFGVCRGRKSMNV